MCSAGMAVLLCVVVFVRSWVAFAVVDVLLMLSAIFAVCFVVVCFDFEFDFGVLFVLFV